MLSYTGVIERLFQARSQKGMQLGLDNTQRLALSLGSPQNAFPTVHIAGTNGKGSVSTKIAKTLEYAGYTVGLYTSPHLYSFRERIQINGKPISQEATVQLMDRILALDPQSTFFELTTLLAFIYFRQENVDIAVIETGLGGRLDATNIITPLLSIITSISLDHTALLGESLEEIAFEKAGIIKPAVPCVLGPKACFKAILERAKALSAPFRLALAIEGFYDLENQSIARLALQLLGSSFDITEESVNKGLKLRPGCRFENVQGIILDVAHNPDGFKRLLQALHLNYPGRAFRFLIGMSQDKPIKDCLATLVTSAAHIHLVKAEGERGASPQQLAEILIQLNYQTFSIETSISEAVAKARSLAEAYGEQLVICGSFFIMHAVKKALGCAEAQDFYNLN
jgi:dihydrofolate synthase/folylpolyglutamate synthase